MLCYVFLNFISTFSKNQRFRELFCCCFCCCFWFISIKTHDWQDQGKGEGISLTPLHHFHQLRGHLDISRVIIVESSPLHIACRQTRTGSLWFPSTSCSPLSYAPYAPFRELVEIQTKLRDCSGQKYLIIKTLHIIQVAHEAKDI